MPKGSRSTLVFFLGVLLGSSAILVASIFLRGNFAPLTHAQTANPKDIPFVCLGSCIVQGPSDINGPGFGNRFEGKDLSNAYITGFQSGGGNNFSGIIFRGAYLPYFSSSNGDIWHNADFTNAWMQFANLDADFTGANFSGANLSNTNLIGNFTNANFTGANLSNAYMQTGDFAGASFNGAHWSTNTTCPNGQFATSNGCTIHGIVTP